MKEEDKDFIKAEVWNRIIRMDDLRKHCGISAECNKSNVYTGLELNYRDVVYAAVEKTIEMLCVKPTLSTSSMKGMHID